MERNILKPDMSLTSRCERSTFVFAVRSCGLACHAESRRLWSLRRPLICFSWTADISTPS
jgi:hypothetical protein